MDGIGIIARRKRNGLRIKWINDKNPGCLKWPVVRVLKKLRTFVRRRNCPFINVQEIEFRMSRYIRKAFWHFGTPKEFSFSFLAGGFIEYAYGDCTYSHWLRALNTEYWQLYQCTVHILDTECVGEYDVWRADPSIKINTIIIRNRNCTLMISYYIRN